MTSIDIAAIERQAREMRAEALGKFLGILANRTGHYLRALGGLLSDALRPLFSWNPHEFNHNFTDPHRPV